MKLVISAKRKAGSRAGRTLAYQRSEPRTCRRTL
jgi:hypothetical protein